METIQELAERLGKVSHFMKLPLSDRLAIVLAGQMRLFSIGTDIFTEGEPCSGMFVLLKGQVHIYKLGPHGQQNIIAIIDPVIMFNEVALLDGGPNPYSAVASQNCLIWQIRLEAYQGLLERYAQEQYMSVAIGLLRIMSIRYRQLLESYADISFLTVPVRVAKFIYEISQQGRLVINRSEISINEMAGRIASVPEAISRALNFLKCQGIIESTRTSIKVLKPDELARLALAEPDIIKKNQATS